MLVRLWSSDPAPALGFRVVDAVGNGLARVVWGVDSLILAVADVLAARFSVCTVRGEISGWSRAASGHCYFNLKDADGGTALLRCAMFRRAAGLLDFAPADGQRVEVRGRVGVYEPRGELQLIVESLQRAGAGTLYEEFLRRKARLDAEGLFDASRKRPIVVVPRCIGVITSLGAAALGDVITSLQRRAPHVRVIVYPSLVQGAEAPAALCAAFALAAQRAEIDTLIVCRGGGSLEDLMAFNDERVVRTIAAARVPVVCGVGHESDMTLADLVADLRAPTPTAAAELAVAAQQDLEQALQQQGRSLRRSVEHQLQTHAQRLDRSVARLGRPAERIAAESGRLALFERRLQHGARAALVARREALERLQLGLVHRRQASIARHAQTLELLGAKLLALNPQATVQRGYALIETEAGTLVLDPDQLKVDRDLNVHLARGIAQVRLASSKRK